MESAISSLSLCLIVPLTQKRISANPIMIFYATFVSGGAFYVHDCLLHDQNLLYILLSIIYYVRMMTATRTHTKQPESG